MIKQLMVVFSREGMEKRQGLQELYINLSDISSVENFEESASSRIVMKNGRSYLVDGCSDSLIVETAEKENRASALSFSEIHPAMTDLHMFSLIKEERPPQSWLGRMFADAVHLVKGGSEPLPPLRVTHDLNGRKLTRAELCKIYPQEASSSVDEGYIASQPNLAPSGAFFVSKWQPETLAP